MAHKISTRDIPHMTVTELKARIDKGEDLMILDVREEDEHQFCCLQGSVLIPLKQVPDRLSELDPKKEIVVHCRSGGRSLRVATYLKQHGYDKVSNLTGGILAWSDQIDPSIPKY